MNKTLQRVHISGVFLSFFFFFNTKDNFNFQQPLDQYYIVHRPMFAHVQGCGMHFTTLNQWKIPTVENANQRCGKIL